MRSVAARLEALERTAPLPADTEVLIQRVAADEGIPPGELRDTISEGLRRYRGMTPQAMAEAIAIEQECTPEEILESAAALAEQAGQL